MKVTEVFHNIECDCCKALVDEMHWSVKHRNRKNNKMKELVDKLKAFTTKERELSKEMEKTLIEFVQKAGGKIDTANEDKCYDSIYAYVWDEYEETYVEKQILEVKVENNNLIVRLDYCYSTEEDCEYSIFGGLILINVTLYNLCECLWEYVDYKDFPSPQLEIDFKYD